MACIFARIQLDLSNEPSLNAPGQKFADLFKTPAGSPKVARHARWLGRLRGSWFDIGVAYGSKCGDLIRWIYDEWMEWVVNPVPNAKGISTREILDRLTRSEEEVSALNPSLLEFAKGVAIGATPELMKARHSAILSDYHKILFMNCYSLAASSFPGLPNWRYQKLMTRMGECTGLALLPGATQQGKTLVGHNTQFGLGMGLFGVVYEAIPDSGNLYWSINPAGLLTWNCQMNERGVAISEFDGGVGDEAAGVPSSFLMINAITRANTMDEVVELLTLGDKEYRGKTQRKTILRESGSNFLVTEANKACMVETTARHYGIRYPGDLGEEDFIIGANLQFCNSSFNEENRRIEEPMTRFGRDEGTGELPTPGTCTRYWTLYWAAMYNRGRIDEEMLMSNNFLAGHYWYDRLGRRTDYLKDGDKWQSVNYAYAHSTVCGHSGGYPEKFNNELPYAKIFSIDDRKAYWTLGRPCSWVGDWDNIKVASN